MIEDDLRDLLETQLPGTDVYARMIPLTLPECVVVQEMGGAPSSSSIRRAEHTVTLMAVSRDRSTAIRRLRAARDALVSCIPFDSADSHYYTAVSVADGSLKRKALNGPAYIEYVDLRVVVSL